MIDLASIAVPAASILICGLGAALYARLVGTLDQTVEKLSHIGERVSALEAVSKTNT